jgi:hypothetical protein
VDDFGIKYVGRQHADHLIHALEQLYKCSTDWTGSLYCGLTIQWNYQDNYVAISMPNYVAAALHKFQHPATTKPKDAPHAWIQPNYGAKQQYAAAPDISERLPPTEITRIQQILGTFLYYAIAVDSTMLVTLGTLVASTQANATVTTAEAIVQLLNYAATHHNAVVRFLVLYLHSDASYLSEPKARSRAGGHFYLSNKPADPKKPPLQPPPINSAIHTTCHILRNIIMASTAEAEVAALFVDSQEAVPIRTKVEEMGHPQPPGSPTTTHPNAV